MQFIHPAEPGTEGALELTCRRLNNIDFLGDQKEHGVEPFVSFVQRNNAHCPLLQEIPTLQREEFHLVHTEGVCSSGGCCVTLPLEGTEVLNTAFCMSLARALEGVGV